MKFLKLKEAAIVYNIPQRTLASAANRRIGNRLRAIGNTSARRVTDEEIERWVKTEQELTTV
jgi:hypothetical protein